MKAIEAKIVVLGSQGIEKFVVENSLFIIFGIQQMDIHGFFMNFTFH